MRNIILEAPAVSGRTCIHAPYPGTNICGAPAARETAEGWLCEKHEAIVLQLGFKTLAGWKERLEEQVEEAVQEDLRKEHEAIQRERMRNRRVM